MSLLIVLFVFFLDNADNKYTSVVVEYLIAIAELNRITIALLTSMFERNYSLSATKCKV